jgi:hypothetical protein
MAISLYSYWEVQSLGNNNNSGVFDPATTMSATLSSANVQAPFQQFPHQIIVLFHLM